MLHQGNFVVKKSALSFLFSGDFFAIESDNIGQEFQLLGGELPMGATHLLIEVSGINEQHFVMSIGVAFRFIEKPEGTGQGDGIKKFEAMLTITSTAPDSMI